MAEPKTPYRFSIHKLDGKWEIRHHFPVIKTFDTTEEVSAYIAKNYQPNIVTFPPDSEEFNCR